MRNGSARRARLDLDFDLDEALRDGALAGPVGRSSACTGGAVCPRFEDFAMQTDPPVLPRGA
jgi:hypothetical protein